ncbi:MAG: hypothetical protein JOZ02_10340 [Acidobacteria bacterium]|nr:hypothetical protein [Acidobacteriota bacterium]
MSDEKRQTRLLPFRLRRAARTDARANDAEDFSADAELTALLRTWDVPARDAGAGARLLADFRASVQRPPLWRRALSAQVRVPLPVAACMGLLLLGSLYVLGARARTPRVEPAAAQAEAPPAAVRVVEVPVVQERVVTRTVYVEKKGRSGEQVASRRQPASEESARRDNKNARDAEAPERQEPAQGQDAHAGYFTHVDMKDFQPTNEVKFRIVSRGGTDEK